MEEVSKVSRLCSYENSKDLDANKTGNISPGRENNDFSS